MGDLNIDRAITYIGQKEEKRLREKSEADAKKKQNKGLQMGR